MFSKKDKFGFSGTRVLNSVYLDEYAELSTEARGLIFRLKLHLPLFVCGTRALLVEHS